MTDTSHLMTAGSAMKSLVLQVIDSPFGLSGFFRACENLLLEIFSLQPLTSTAINERILEEAFKATKAQDKFAKKTIMLVSGH